MSYLRFYLPDVDGEEPGDAREIPGCDETHPTWFAERAAEYFNDHEDG